MIFLYFGIGFIAALIAAAPPGAANVSVVKTAIDKGLSNAVTIIIGAAIGEVLLSFIALHCTMSLTDFFKDNPWVQIMVFCLFFLIGVFFLLKRKVNFDFSTPKKIAVHPNKFWKGFLLSFINPPVLIFWVVTYTFTQKHLLRLSEMSSWIVLLLFFLGVFAGKALALYGYGRWGKHLEKKKDNHSRLVDNFIGVALIAVGIVQGIRFFIS